MDLSKLAEPFKAEGIEWRVQQSGIAKSGKPYAMVLAYLTNRAIMQRLDDVCGIGNWKNEFNKAPDGGIMAGISIRVERKDGDAEWVTKYDGASNTDIEAVKGGLSSAMKRAAVQWGMGRYLYKMETTFVNLKDKDGKYRIKIKGDNGAKDYYGTWDAPALPAWAIPKNDKTAPTVLQEPEHQEEAPAEPAKMVEPKEAVAILSEENPDLPPIDSYTPEPDPLDYEPAPARPSLKAPAKTYTTSRPASPAQVRMMYAIMRDKGFTEEAQVKNILHNYFKVDSLTAIPMGAASSGIDELQRLSPEGIKAYDQPF